MAENSMIVENSMFAGYRITEKLSVHHDGEREVYHAVDAEGQNVVLTVYNTNCKRYATDSKTRTCQVDFIDEVRFCKEYAEAAESKDTIGLPKFLGYGVDTYNHHRYAWMAQEYVEGNSLDDEIISQGVISIKDAMEIVKRLSQVITAVAGFTRGGGHYNITSDNIIVRYDKDILVDARLIGFGNIGSSYNGHSLIGENCLDYRFRAPETFKGIFNLRSDIYSLGMVVLLMFTGYSANVCKKINTVGTGNDRTGLPHVNSKEFYNALWNVAKNNLSRALCLVLRKATNISPELRFSTVAKLYGFLSKVESSLTKIRHATEDDEDDEDDVPPLGRMRPECTWEGSEIHQPALAESREATFNESAEGCGLDEVAGMSELKALLRRDFVRIIHNPEFAQAYGIKPSNCTLLYGPQGCGKTFIAEKAAQESGLKYKIVNPSELGSIYVHGSQQKIAELFAEAEKNGPMILIFDEFDAIVPKRDSSLSSNQANEVNEMLTQLNNCASRGIYVLATTNRPTLIDPAVMRKGRTDRTVYVPLPDMKTRTELFRLAIGKRPHVDIDFRCLASATDNFAGSDIAYIVEETARRCFEDTLDGKQQDPIPLSMPRLLETISSTQPSVSKSQREEFLKLKAIMENQGHAERKKVGFALATDR